MGLKIVDGHPIFIHRGEEIIDVAGNFLYTIRREGHLECEQLIVVYRYVHYPAGERGWKFGSWLRFNTNSATEALAKAKLLWG